MELTAAVQAFRALKRPCRVDFFTDFEYLKKGITEWMPTWRARSWRRKGGALANVDLWKELDAVIQPHQIQWHWVRSHAGEFGENERVDQLARQAIYKPSSVQSIRAHPTTEYENILIERRENVGLVHLNRPQALNVLNSRLVAEVMAALQELDTDNSIGAIVINGSERAFAAGADIKEMAAATPVEMLLSDRIALFDRMRSMKKPLIAAVSGWCLGGGNELAMACDMMVASETARFGQPEITIGVIPGAAARSAWRGLCRESHRHGDGAEQPHADRRRGATLRSGEPRGAGGALPGGGAHTGG